MLQDKLMTMQKELVEKEFPGQAGNGLVQVVLTGEYKIKSLKINPQCVDPEDVEGLEDLIKAAFTDAIGKVDGGGTSSMQGMPNIPGLGDMGNLGELLKGFGGQV